jgi:hypothetical protein
MLPPEKLGFDDLSQYDLSAPEKVKLLKSLVRRKNQPIIPGTSLKGATRSLVEMFTHSCPSVGDRRRMCKYRKETSRVCPACRIFGAMGYRGHIHFDDGVFITLNRGVVEIPTPYSQRPRNWDRRYYPHHLVNREASNWPLEVVEAGCRFLIQSTFKNLSAAELGAVLIALGAGEWQLCPKFGGGKNAGLGAVQMQELNLFVLDLESAYTNFDKPEKFVEPDPYLDAAQSLLRKDVMEELQQNLGCQNLEPLDE